MKEFIEKFNVALDAEDKEQCIVLVQNALNEKKLTIVQLYLDVLAPALNAIACGENDFKCIWQEHVKTGIVRTIMESSYPFLLKTREEYGFKKIEKIVMVFCPPNEYHEVGARMVADFFTIAGYKVYYVGNNTPKKAFLAAIEKIDPHYVAISVSNVYHLSQTRDTIRDIRQFCPTTVKIIVGGQAFSPNPSVYKEIGADFYFKSFDDIVNLRREEK
jgi:methanogenic corrinoid protein MtbC1